MSSTLVTAERTERPAETTRTAMYGGTPGWVARLIRGKESDPAWVRPGLLGLLGATAVLYLWGLGASGWANAYYAAAVQAGSQSWSAFFFGSLDSSNSITVDKTPASLWVMDLSARIFGLSSWSMLVPQALMGVATVFVVYVTVRRWFTPGAALLAGAVVATTPVAALMFRFNNPDALLTLLLALAAYATVRALERAGTWWLVLAGGLVGFGFLAKMLQALVVVPALAITYLIAAPAALRRRLLQLVAAGGALVVSAGWWVAIVELMPASSRPYIGGSQTNSVLELMLGYNGFGRLTGDEVGSVTGGVANGPGGGAGAWGATGLLRMFGADIGGQIAWLLPAALGAIVVGFVLARGGGRTNRQRAAFLLWGLWLVVTAVVFSLMGGIFHAYYTVALAPAVGALVGQAGSMLWWYRRSVWARLVLAVGVLGTSALAVALLARSAEWLPWLRVVVLVAGVVAAAALVILPVLTARTPVLSEEMAADGAAPPTVAAPHRVGPAVIATGALAVFAVLAAPAAYAMQTSSTPHTGSIPSAGPAVTSGFGRGPQWGMPGGPQAGGGPFGGGGPPQLGQGLGQRQGQPGQQSQRGRGRAPGGSRGAAPGGPGRAGTAGNGLLQAPVVNSALVAALEADANSYRWVAATIGANGAAGYQLAARQPVMAIGGFNGSDPSPTLEQFQAYVAAGDIHYYLGGDGFRSNGGSDEPSRIAAWVQENFTPTSIGGDLAYDLTQPLSGVGESS